nr:hypothetical protein CFP56_66844 [Quercus suber]
MTGDITCAISCFANRIPARSQSHRRDRVRSSPGSLFSLPCSNSVTHLLHDPVVYLLSKPVHPRPHNSREMIRVDDESKYRSQMKTEASMSQCFFTAGGAYSSSRMITTSSFGIHVMMLLSGSQAMMPPCMVREVLCASHGEDGATCNASAVPYISVKQLLLAYSLRCRKYMNDHEAVDMSFCLLAVSTLLFANTAYASKQRDRRDVVARKSVGTFTLMNASLANNIQSSLALRSPRDGKPTDGSCDPTI